MSRDCARLLPVSVVLALLLGLLPLPPSIAPLRPYWLALVVAVLGAGGTGPRRPGFAFVVGIVADLAFGSLLGEQALRLTIMVFILKRFRARLRFFPLSQQALAIGALLVNDRVVTAAVHVVLRHPGAAGRVLAGAAARHAAVAAGVPAVRRGAAAQLARSLVPSHASASPPAQERRRRGRAAFRCRAALAFLGVVVALGGLALWYFRLQVLQHSEYATRSKPTDPAATVPGRGLILDRGGRVLADNVPAYRLVVVPDEAGDPQQGLRWPGLPGAHASRTSPASRRAAQGEPRLPRGHPEAARRRGRGRALRGGPPALPRRRAGALPQPPLSAARPVRARGRLRRPHRRGRPRQDGRGRRRAHPHRQDRAGAGYEDALRGKVGYEKIETNVEGRALRTLGRVPAVPGADLRLSVDLDLQRAMVIAFGEMEGSAVAVDPRTGEVLAMVSLPSYDSNLFVNGISHADYKALSDNPLRPQFNRNASAAGRPDRRSSR